MHRPSKPNIQKKKKKEKKKKITQQKESFKDFF